MQPYEHVTNLGRRLAARIVGLSAGVCRQLTFGFVLVLLSFVGADTVTAAARSWPDLPVQKMDWEAVRAMPDGPQIIERELHRQGEYNRRWRAVHDLLGGQHVSRLSQELLARRGLGPALLKDGSVHDPAKAGEPDVLRVVLVRIGFETNRDSTLTTITGGGDLMLDPLADPGPLEIDPPPHNKAFFESHLVGLTEYYEFMSGGRLQIEGTVLPEGENDSYKLSDVADYGPGANSFWTLESLERLVQDMITTTDAGMITDGVGSGLADYDDETPLTYVIFVHSGSDWQSDINGDSPNDIPTFFVTLGEPIGLSGTNLSGNPGQLSECSIIPETTNQDGFVGSIAAAFYHEFGHALGLPDVYDTQSGLPSVGIWDLMDSGTNLPVNIGALVVDDGDTTVVTVSATGVLPPSLSAWCKSYLGWLVTDDVSSPVPGKDNYLLPAVGVPREQYQRYNAGFGDFNLAYPQAYRAGISPREYFLIENRWVPMTDEPLPFSDLRFERDEATGVIQYLAGLSGGTWENSGLYDYFMPAGGLLVWHVNEDRIAAELGNNTINAYGDGLRLVEADGIQDIGVLDAYVLGWFGSWRDPFGGIDPDGNETGFNDLYTSGFPSSLNFDRSYSGVRLSEMAQRVARTASVMKFEATLEPVLEGFPWEIAPPDPDEPTPLNGVSGLAIETSSLTPVDVAGEQVLIFSDKKGPDAPDGMFFTSLYGIRPNGAARWPNSSGLPNWYDGAFAIIGSPLVGSPVAVSHPAGGFELIWASENGTVATTLLPTGVADPSELWHRSMTPNLVAGPRVLRWEGAESRILVPAGADSLYILDRSGDWVGAGWHLAGSNGETVTEMRLNILPAADGGTDRVVAFTDVGWFLFDQDATGFAANPVFTAYDIVPAQPPQWSAVIPVGSAEFSVRIFGDEGELGAWAVAPDGGIETRSLLREMDGPLVCEPAVADLDGDGRHDLIMATATRIYAFQLNGVPLRGFPVRFFDLFPLDEDTRVQGPLVIADGTGDGVNNIFFNTTGGHLVGLGPTGALLGNLPLRWGDQAEAGLAVGGQDNDRILWLASAGGYTGGFLDRIATNGRLSGYGLMPAQVAAKRTSEWLGSGGGVTRRGPVGEAKVLGGSAPVSAEQELVYLYPNPLRIDDVTARFYSQGTTDARLSIYNLEGELIVSESASVVSGAVNEINMSLPNIVSGMYLARLEFDGPNGPEIRTLTLAVEK